MSSYNQTYLSTTNPRKRDVLTSWLRPSKAQPPKSPGSSFSQSNGPQSPAGSSRYQVQRGSQASSGILAQAGVQVPYDR
ncbi:hypothetical protein K440DRAFT_289713 [Wilcoxina mikolae CBS 423.85]|nr:hypothetical protein K440DRAFT_289713 [Wilcoxina mikolae CBS 423.85]